MNQSPNEPINQSPNGMSFKLVSPFEPTGDQPQAIQQLVDGVESGERAQVLLGVTGSGKTFTIANAIARLNRPTLVLTHNKTLTAQLYGEFQDFFPDNAVEYFVSYYDYYQPEAYITVTDTYIEKDLSINEEVDKLRLRATSSLLSGRRDIIIVASVSCIYGMGNPEDYKGSIIRIEQGQVISRNNFLYQLVESLYSRTEADFRRATFRVKGDTVSINLPYVEYGYRVTFFGDEIEEIEQIETESGHRITTLKNAAIFPANLYVAPRERIHQIVHEIQDELHSQVQYFEQEGRFLEAKRVKERTSFDLEMMKELGYCNGVENYSRFFDGRKPGTRPFCLLDYFPDDFLLVVDESHVTIPQVRGMWGGDRARKLNLVNFGFRLPSALDNRPLRFEEWEERAGQRIYVSATPADYELERCAGVVVEQIIRPTGLMDPEVEVRPASGQVDNLLGEIRGVVANGHRVLVTTLTKRMAEELTEYYADLGIRIRYLHSDIDTVERMEIIRELREGGYDVLVGINLLREGLDIPEVALVGILDADKEGFLRSGRSLIQTIGRAARNVEGRVILYADQRTDSIDRTLAETARRREVQAAYNREHGITPRSVVKKISSLRDSIWEQDYVTVRRGDERTEPAVPRHELPKLLAALRKEMGEAAAALDFERAADLRDRIRALEEDRIRNT